MHIDNDALFLYNLTLLHPTAYTHSALGQFRGIRKAFELVLVSSTLISLYALDPSTGKLTLISLQAIMGTVFALDIIRPTGSTVDLLVVSSDSGNLSILQYSPDPLLFIPVAQLPLAKNGFSRLHSGLYLAVDPFSRAICVGSLERAKFVVAVSSVDGKISLDLPLEAPSPKIACLCLAALELRLQNPIFAALECTDPDSLMLNYYEFDQGLNHIIRRKARGSPNLPPSSSHLVPLPDPIGGVLVCCDTFLIYDSPATSNNTPIYIPLPRPPNSRSRRITCHTLHRLKKNDFFLVLQSLGGDLIKVSADYNSDRDVLVGLSASYFSSIPPSASIHIFKSGYLFASTWLSDQKLYQIQGLENSQVSPISSIGILGIDAARVAAESAPEISPHVHSLLEESDSLASHAGIVDLAISANDILTLCSSHLKRFRRGTPTTIIVESPLPLIPTNVLTCRLSSAAADDQYLVLSSLKIQQTLILSIGEVVEEVEDSRFVLDQHTLAVHQLGMFSVAQVHTTGIRHVRRPGTGLEVSTTDWFPPAGIRIVAADASNTQVVVGLSNDEVCYFEVDPLDDQLIEYQDRLQASLAITSLALWHGQLLKSAFVAMGCTDSTVSIISLQTHNCLETLSLQALSAVPSSLLILSLHQNTHPSVHIGLESGVLTRTALDPFSGVLSNSRSQYLGNQSVSLVAVASPVAKSSDGALLALSSRSYLGYSQNGSYSLLPILGITATCVAPIVSEDVGGQAIVAISHGQLVIFTVGDSETGFDPSQNYVAESTLLTYPPRNMALDGNIAYITEFALPAPLTSESNEGAALDVANSPDVVIADKAKPTAAGETTAISKALVKRAAKNNSTTSCVEVVDHSIGKVLQKEDLPLGEQPLSSAILRFESAPKQRFFVVGCTLISTHTHSLYTFTIAKDLTLKHVHTTTVDEPPHALLEFDGKLSVGMGPYIRLYDTGRRQLLRKASSRIGVFEKIVRVAHCGHRRLAVADARQATAFVKYDADENSFTPFANDCAMRHLTSLCVLDYDTVITGDKWGNVHASRAPRTLSFSSDHDWPLVKNQDAFLNASGGRLDNAGDYYLGDLVTSLATREGQGVLPAIIYGGIQGLIGCFAPLASKQEAEYFLRLQNLMEKHFAYDFADFNRDQHIPNLLGKDHIKYRSSFNPRKNVIDGDFLALFATLRPLLKLTVASGMDRTPAQVESKIESMKLRCMWT